MTILMEFIAIRPLFLFFLATIRTRFILTHTHHPGNVGAAARAIKTMGFGELVLVEPSDPKVLNRKRTKEGASGAIDILDNARVVGTLADALTGIDVSCATGMPVDMSQSRGHQSYAEPRPYLQELTKHRSNEISSIAFVFGNERYGMRQEDFSVCDVILGIPTNPKFGSLNLASAVQLVAYDWRQALGGFPPIKDIPSN